MDDLDRQVVAVRADTAGFARDVAAMRAELDGPLAASADRAGRVLETALLRSVRTGKFGFEDLKATALAVLADIAANAVRQGIGSILGGGQAGNGGLLTMASGVLGSVLGLPGRATGGPVGPGRAYMVGERGPELFVPTASGTIAPTASGVAGARDVRIALTINAPANAAPEMLARSSRQVARAVRAALVNVE